MKTMQRAGAALGLFLLCQTALAAAPEPQAIALNIESQRLDQALSILAQQTGLQLLFRAETSIEGLTAPRLVGSFTPRAALERLLANTALDYEFVNDRTVSIRPRAAADSNRTTSVYPAANSGALRLTQADASAPDATAGSNAKPATDTTTGSEAQTLEQLEEIVVTGTHIRGVGNPTAPTVVYDRKAIENSGYGSTQQFIQSIPQNFAGGQAGASEDGAVGPGSNSSLNVSGATGVNLRGLGTTSTLVVINGNRVAPSAYGAVVDVSLIPLAAIDRIEVLTDGSSAIYGSDAVAGVVNFILRRDYEGAETSLRYGGVTSGSLQEETASQVFGQSWQTGNVVASAQYQHRDDLPASQRGFSAAAQQPTDLLPETTRLSALINARQQLTDEIDLFADGIGSRSRRLTDSSDTTRTQSSKSETEFASLHAGVGYDLPRDWRVEVSGLYSSEQTDLRHWNTPIQLPTVNGALFLANDFTIKSADLKADGTVLQLSAGALKMAVGASYRNERFSSRLPQTSEDRPFERNVKAAFAEAYVPLLDEDSAVPLVRSLGVSGAIRYDRYSDFGDTTNPRLGLHWSPVAGLDIRAGYSTSFRAPNASEKFEGGFLAYLNVPFAAPGGGDTPVFVAVGNDPFLSAEESEEFTFGLEFRPSFAPGLSLTANYYAIDFKDRIVRPPFDVGALLQPDLYGALIMPLGSDAEAKAFIDAAIADGALFADFIGTGEVGVRNVFDQRLKNAARVKQNGLDVGLQYELQTGLNKWAADVNLALINKIDTSFTSESAATDLVNTYGSPLQLRYRAGLSWSREQLTVSGAVNYTNSYDDISVFPVADVDPWTTVDLNARYAFHAPHQLAIALSCINLFDEAPPFVGGLGNIHYDPGAANPLERQISVQLTARW